MNSQLVRSIGRIMFAHLAEADARRHLRISPMTDPRESVILCLIRHDKARISPDHNFNPTISSHAIPTPNPRGLSRDHETLDKPITPLMSGNKPENTPGQKTSREKNGSLEHLMCQSSGRA